MTFGHPSIVAARDTLGSLWPRRRNGPFQPNQETSQVRRPAPSDKQATIKPGRKTAKRLEGPRNNNSYGKIGPFQDFVEKPHCLGCIVFARNKAKARSRTPAWHIQRNLHAPSWATKKRAEIHGRASAEVSGLLAANHRGRKCAGISFARHLRRRRQSVDRVRPGAKRRNFVRFWKLGQKRL